MRQQTKTKKLCELRQRLEKATQEATEEKQIGHRTGKAIAYLLQGRDLRRILAAVITLGEWLSIGGLLREG